MNWSASSIRFICFSSWCYVPRSVPPFCNPPEESKYIIPVLQRESNCNHRTDGRTTQVGSGGFSWLDSKSVAWQRHGENGWLARGTVICKRNCSFFRLGGRYSSNLVTAKLKLLQSPVASSTARGPVDIDLKMLTHLKNAHADTVNCV